MWKLKGFQRCGEDIFIEQDEYGGYKKCLQCGDQAGLSCMTKPQTQLIKDQKQLAFAGS